MLENRLRSYMTTDDINRPIFRPAGRKGKSYLLSTEEEQKKFRNLAVFKCILDYSNYGAAALIILLFITQDALERNDIVYIPFVLVFFAAYIAAHAYYRAAVAHGVKTLEIVENKADYFQTFVQSMKSYPRIVFIIVFYIVFPIIILILMAFTYVAFKSALAGEPSLFNYFMIIFPTIASIVFIRFIYKASQ